MYNLFVTADCEAWNGSPEIFDVSRCLRDFTDSEIKEKYSALTQSDIDFLVSLPCLFAYEDTCEKNARAGRLLKVQRKDGRLRVFYEISVGAAELSPTRIAELSWDLGIGDWEMNRTHWALKKEDLYAVLQEGPTTTGSSPVDVSTQVFDVALSFPGEIRNYVESVARELVKLVGHGRVFYDNFFKAQLARPNLDTLLQDIYRNRSKLIVAFLCAAYSEKEWCGIELRAIRDLIKARKDTMVMYVRTDQGEVPGVFSTDGFIDAENHTPSEIAALIFERLRIMHQK
jgi:hypothetical protein